MASAQPDQLDYECLAFRLSQGKGYSLADNKPDCLPYTGHVTFSRTGLRRIRRPFSRPGESGSRFLSALTCLGTAAAAWQLSDKLSCIAGRSLVGGLSRTLLLLHALQKTSTMRLCAVFAAAFTVASLRRASHILALIAALFWVIAILTRSQLIFMILLPWPILLFGKSVLAEPAARFILEQCSIVIMVFGGMGCSERVRLGQVHARNSWWIHILGIS